MQAHPELPAVFVFDEPLLRRLRLSYQRLVFLTEALAEIAEQTSALAIGVAKQVVGRELRPEDHADLIRNALDQVPSKN